MSLSQWYSTISTGINYAQKKRLARVYLSFEKYHEEMMESVSWRFCSNIHNKYLTTVQMNLLFVAQ